MASSINIEALLASGERINLECKKAQSNVPVDVWKTYSAFANTYGGTILLGIVEHLKEKDLQKRFQIVGVEDSRKIVTDFWNKLISNESATIRASLSPSRQKLLNLNNEDTNPDVRP